MRVVVQRSKNSCVKVNKEIVGKIDFGLVLLVSFTHTDNEKNIDKMIDKIINIRIFDDENKVMNKSILDINGKILSISQFTLYADTSNGRRPSYKNVLNNVEAKKLYDMFNKKLSEFIKVETGIFREEMEVSIINDGPVTLVLEN